MIFSFLQNIQFVNQRTYANLSSSFCLLQLALTIVYIAVGVFAAGWIGKVKCLLKLIMRNVFY